MVHQARINPTGLAWERFWVAEADGEVIGCAQVKPHRDGSRELASLVVQLERRGWGVARALIEHFLAAESLPLYLTCRSNLGSFYRRFGFRIVPVGEMPVYFRWAYRLVNAGRLLRGKNPRMLVMVSTSR